MRKIIESVLMSVDGVVGNPAAWGVVDYRDDEVQQEAVERLSGCDAMLMGKRTYEAFAEVWPPQTTDRGDVVAQVTKLKQSRCR
jgi:dihydrofolate reductase